MLRSVTRSSRRASHAIWQRDIHARAPTMSLATAQAAERVAPTVDRAARLRFVILQTSARKWSQLGDGRIGNLPHFRHLFQEVELQHGSARIEDLGPGDFVKLGTAACVHTAIRRRSRR